jgi:CDP-diacylglycerol---glycerol-3-phosphate 3-phosphatidyltransferase
VPESTSGFVIFTRPGFRVETTPRIRTRLVQLLPDWLKNGYLKVIEPVAGWLVRHQVHPNTITAIGTGCAVIAGAIYASGHISVGGWFFGLTALFDVLDGTVARRTGRTSTFGAFLDSTLDRIADAAILGGLAVFYAINPVHASVPMLVWCMLGMIGAFLTSYTRARAEALGLDAKVGVLQRPERVVLLSAPQAFFGLALDGWILATIIVLLTVTAWITVVQRVQFVYRQTSRRTDDGNPTAHLSTEKQPWLGRRKAVHR